MTNDGTQTYAYDAENRIVGVDSGTTATYSYDPSNQRYKKATGGATTHYVWQGLQVIAEHNGSTGAVVTDYVYSGSRMIANVSSGSTQYFLSDRLSVRITLNSSGSVLGSQAHLPFGEDFAESATQEKHHFTNYERDGEVATDYAVNRQYAFGVARFTRVDPQTYGCSGKSPQGLNRYSYVKNDPVNSVDPQGLDPMSVMQGFFCTFFPVLCGRDEIGFPSPRQDPDRGSELLKFKFGSATAGRSSSTTLRIAVSVYRFDHWEPVGGGLTACVYLPYWPTSRGSCLESYHRVITNNPTKCQSPSNHYVITETVYFSAFGFDGCLEVGPWQYSPIPIPCV